MRCRDLDLLRVKLLKELEGPWQRKCDLLAKVRLAARN